MLHVQMSRLCLTFLAMGLVACGDPMEEAPTEGVVSEPDVEVVSDANAESDAEAPPHSERGGIGMRMREPRVGAEQAVAAVDIRRSLVVTEKNILARFGGRRVFNQLHASHGGTGFTPDQLFRQLWDTQNPAPGQPDLSGMPHCSDNGNTLNGFPYACRPGEGVQARTDAAVTLDSYVAVGLYNRFDLMPANGANCGEYRIVLAKLPSSLLSRSLVIFEAVLPNPRPALGIEGCRQVADFWTSLSADVDPLLRATKLEDFYFRGLPGLPPVVDMRHYGNNPRGEGQVRTNQFLQPPEVTNLEQSQPWLLHEFKLVRDCGASPSCTLKFAPATVKVNPFGGLFNPAASDARAVDFRGHFITQVASLAVNDLNLFNYSVPERFNAGQSDAQTAGAVDDYVGQLGTGPSAFHGAIQAELTRIGSPLAPRDVVARAQALSCAGCHQRSNTQQVGGGLTWPASAFFVHSTENDDPADPGRFALSSALTQQFLPFRKTVLEGYLATRPTDTAFVAQELPATVRVGQRFTVSVTLRNSGTTAWSEPNGIRLKAKSGTPSWGVSSVLLAPGEVIHKGSEKTFRFQVTAPPTPGPLVFQRVMAQAGVEFGEPSAAVVINVVP